MEFDSASGSAFPIGTTTVTFTATDVSGNSTSCSFKVTVNDIPVINSCPSDITVTAAPDVCSAVVSFNSPVAIDNCGSISVGSQTFNLTNTVQTFTVPAGVTSVNITALGAGGGNLYGWGYTGGAGVSLQGDFSVTPGQTLYLLVGGRGADDYYYAGSGGGALRISLNMIYSPVIFKTQYLYM